MDAAIRLRNWLVAAGLSAWLPIAGCQAADTKGIARGQQPPSEPPGGPLSPANTPPPPQPTQSSQPVQVAGYVPGGAGLVSPLLGDAVTSRCKIVAIVGGNLVTDHEVWEATKQRLGEYAQLDRHEREVKEKAIYREELRRIIERELILDEMFNRLKKAKPQAIEEIRSFAGQMADRQLREFMKMYKTKNEEEFKDILKSQGLSVPVIRRQLERQMMTEEYVRTMLKEKGRTVGFGEIREYYERNPKEFQNEDTVKWLDLFVSFNKFATPRDAYNHAESVRAEAARGGDFVALVKKHDHGTASLRNGEGTGTKRGQISPVDVEPAVWALQPGQVSGLIETPAGYHIVKVVERQVAGLRPFDEKLQAEIREKLLRKLRMAEYDRLVEDLWRRTVVKVSE